MTENKKVNILCKSGGDLHKTRVMLATKLMEKVLQYHKWLNEHGEHNKRLSVEIERGEQFEDMMDSIITAFKVVGTETAGLYAEGKLSDLGYDSFSDEQIEHMVNAHGMAMGEFNETLINNGVECYEDDNGSLMPLSLKDCRE